MGSCVLFGNHILPLLISMVERTDLDMKLSLKQVNSLRISVIFSEILEVDGTFFRRWLNFTVY